MKGKKWLSLALAGMLAVSALAGCGSSSSSTGGADTASTSTGSADYDLYIFNNKGENADAMAAAAEAFGKEKGVKVKAFSLGSGVNSDDTLRTEMNSKNKPAPTNLEVPPHKYLSEGRLIIGADDAATA